MSTFDGIVREFPDIRVDFFRRSVDQPPPLACFLSHVHSDHLAGLESLRSPFVYCSAATREILLRLERYPCRINFAKGILEARVQTFKGLKGLLKPIPLDTPTEIELAPGHCIQVTLIDANHCPGAVMFLIEGDGRAILYTGDIRSEPWHVNSVARNPALIEYTHGIKTLDKIYLDTSFIDDVPFQTKAEGIAELLGKVSRYPPDTIFHLQAWTYGYEDVWIALSKALKSRVHVDDYKMRIFSSLQAKPENDRFGQSIHLCRESPALTGYMCGNTYRPGCLTTDENVRLHSCEKGNYCSTIEKGPVVWIQPIIAHTTGGIDRLEHGIGGGADDLEREVELDLVSSANLNRLLQILGENQIVSESTKTAVRDLLLKKPLSGRNVPLDLDMSCFGDKKEADVVEVMALIGEKLAHRPDEADLMLDGAEDGLPKTIRFPYSRHSSLPELRHLVTIFKPKDVWPCTVDPMTWNMNNVTIKVLFGDCCSGTLFAHDAIMEAWAKDHQRMYRAEFEVGGNSPVSGQSAIRHAQPAMMNTSPQPSHSPQHITEIVEEVCKSAIWTDGQLTEEGSEVIEGSCRDKRNFAAFAGDADDSQDTVASHASIISQLVEGASLVRADAYEAMLRNLGGGEWTAIGLLSTTDHHTYASQDPTTFSDEKGDRNKRTRTVQRSPRVGISKP
ncbi:artemis protein [Verticillium dahliae]